MYNYTLIYCICSFCLDSTNYDTQTYNFQEIHVILLIVEKGKYIYLS
mgnify:CR=1 FL=1